MYRQKYPTQGYMFSKVIPSFNNFCNYALNVKVNYFVLSLLVDITHDHVFSLKNYSSHSEEFAFSTLPPRTNLSCVDNRRGQQAYSWGDG